MRGLVVAMLVSGLLLAGCAEKSNGTTSSSGSPAGAAHGGAKAAVAAAVNVTNHAPTGAIKPVLSNGTKSLNATFAITGQDPDGDAVNWTLAFGDQTTAVTGSFKPLANSTASFTSNVTHAYAKAGLYNITYTLTDGKNSTAYSVRLNVTGGAAIEKQKPITFKGTVSTAGGTESITHPFPVLMAYSKITVTLTWGPVSGLGDVDMDLYTPDGKAAGTGGGSTNTPATTTGETITVTDAAQLKQVGTWKLTVTAFAAANASYTATITFA